MVSEYTTVRSFLTHIEAEEAVLDLQKSGFDMKKISIISKDYQSTEHIRGFLTWKDPALLGAESGGYWGSFFGGFFGILTGAGLIFIPGVGPVVVAGHIVGVLAGWIEGMVVGGVGAALVGGLAGALVGFGIPQDKALKYETEVKAGKFVLLITGTEEELDKAQKVLPSKEDVAEISHHSLKSNLIEV